MNLIGKVFKTGFLATAISILSFLLLLLLFQDVVKNYFILCLAGGFFSLFTIGFSTIFLFVSIVIFNKKKMEELGDWLQSYLLIALLPFLGLTLFIIIEKPDVFKETEFLIVFINCIVSFYASFIFFFSSYKQN